MLIRKLNGNTYDVFGHTGFDNWTRIRRYVWGIKPVAGVQLDRETIRAILSALERHPNGSIDNVAA